VFAGRKRTDILGSGDEREISIRETTIELRDIGKGKTDNGGDVGRNGGLKLLELLQPEE